MLHAKRNSNWEANAPEHGWLKREKTEASSADPALSLNLGYFELREELLRVKPPQNPNLLTAKTVLAEPGHSSTEVWWIRNYISDCTLLEPCSSQLPLKGLEQLPGFTARQF